MWALPPLLSTNIFYRMTQSLVILCRFLLAKESKRTESMPRCWDLVGKLFGNYCGARLNSCEVCFIVLVIPLQRFIIQQFGLLLLLCSKVCSIIFDLHQFRFASPVWCSNMCFCDYLWTPWWTLKETNCSFCSCSKKSLKFKRQKTWIPMRISFQTMTNHSNTCSMFCITVVGHHLKTDTHWDSCAISGNEYQKFSATDTLKKIG